MASSSHNRSQRGLQVWKDVYDFLMADERHLDVYTCGLCEEFMVEVTVVTKCQHGFCAECIRNYFLQDGNHKCPQCSVELGDNPQEYLRFDALTTNLLDFAVEYHLLKSLLRPESSTLPPPPVSNSVPPPPEPNMVTDAPNHGPNM